jgi:molybdate transport system substrate-binding protein
MALAGAVDAGAAEVKVLASTAIKTALEPLVREFETTTGIKVAASYGASGRLQPQIEKGAPCDLAILTAAAVDALAGNGNLIASSVTKVARSGAGVAVRKGAPKPDIASSESLRRALIDAKSIGYSDTGATGQFLVAMFERLGIAAEMKPKMKSAPPGRTGLEALAAGEIEILIPQISEALAAPGVELVGPLPAELQVYTTIVAAIGKNAEHVSEAKSLRDFLLAPAARVLIKAKGLEPG